MVIKNEQRYGRESVEVDILVELPVNMEDISIHFSVKFLKVEFLLTFLIFVFYFHCVDTSHWTIYQEKTHEDHFSPVYK